MITPAFNLTATERVLPKLALDFTTASLDSRVTFTRTTSASNPATYTNSSGYIADSSNNAPRFDYDPISLTCKGLLIEESRTNLCYPSATFGSPWTTTGSFIDTNAATAPTGTVVGSKLREATTTATHATSFSYTQTIGNKVVFSVYAKAAERSRIRMTADASNASVYFDLSAGSVIAGSNGTITDVGNGWYRCSIAHTIAYGSATSFSLFLVSSGTTTSYTGVTNYGAYIWGAQMEVGSFITSYIPTTTAALTRNADVATMTGTNFSDWYNQSEGTMQIIGSPVPPTSSGSGMTAGQIYQASGNFVSISMGVAKRPRLLVYTGGSLVLNAAASSDINAPLNQIAALKSGSISFASNTTAIATNSAQNIPTSMISFGIGYDIFNARSGNIWVQKINYWPMKITNAETQAFSK